MHAKASGNSVCNGSEGSSFSKRVGIMAEYYNEDSSRASSNDGNESVSSTSNSYSDQEVVPTKKNKMDAEQSFDWSRLLGEPNFRAASVSSFKHAPVSYLWDNVTEGMKVEVENTDVDQSSYQTAFWVASVIQIEGYKVLLRFEGFGTDNSKDFWVNLCSEDVHHVGWCATKGKPLIPPKSISGKFPDWREFLVKRLTGARTLPQNFQTKVASGLKSKYELGTQLEVVDKNRICQLRLARVQKIVGKRLHVRYFDTDEDGGFWCHEDSPLIHSAGWAATVGHEIMAPKSYRPETLPRSSFKFANYDHLDLKEGMKLEAIDPLNLSTICAATIKKVLRLGYLMIRVDCYEEDSSGFDWFCYHVTSPYVFPCGFSSSNGLILTPPIGYSKETFEWKAYLAKTSSQAAPLNLLKQDTFKHDFKTRMRLEAADLMDPRLICVGTISHVVGRLLKIHFDGWEEEYDQWLDALSPDIYPLGWCELVGHRLEPPRAPLPTPSVKTKKNVKAKKKTPIRTKPNASRAPLKISGRVTSLGKPNPESNLPERFGMVEALSHLNTGRLSSISPDASARPGRAYNGETDDQVISESMKTREMDKVICDSKTEMKGSPAIPRLIGCPSIVEMAAVDPQRWNDIHVAKFLQINDCGAYCESFKQQGVDGPKLMALTKDQVIGLTGMKVGPAVKIVDLLSQLKRLIQAARARNAALCK